MALNLLNDKDFNNYLTDITYQGASVPHQQNFHGEFESVDYVEQNRDEIVKGILNQYIKLRVREYLLNQSSEPAFELVDKDEEGLPEWTQKVFANGENIYRFRGAKMSYKLRDDIMAVRDFLYDAAGQYVDKVVARARETDKKPKINYAFLKTTNEYDMFDKALDAAHKWHENLAKEMVRRNKNREFLEKSLIGAEHVMDLSDGMQVYKLTTPEALDFESDNMGNCAGSGIYDEGVIRGTIQIYSIRDASGEPHVTLEVRNGNVFQCKGKANNTPKKKYIFSAREFVKKQNLNITHDEHNFGLITIDAQKYDIFNLPKKLVVNGNVDLSYKGLEELPDLSQWEIKGSFYCDNNKLTTLRGAPEKVGGSFLCGHNELKTLHGAPKSVGGFACNDNKLTTLDGAPEKVGGPFVGGPFICNNNELTSLQGAPTCVVNNFDCSNNKLESLKGCPQTITGDFNCDNNQLSTLDGAPQSVSFDFRCARNQLTLLRGAPESIARDFFCQDNKLTTLDGAPRKVGGKFGCWGNQLTSLRGAPQSVGGDFDCSENPLQTIDGAPKTVGGNFICGDDELSAQFNALADVNNNRPDVNISSNEEQIKNTISSEQDKSRASIFKRATKKLVQRLESLKSRGSSIENDV